MVDPRMEPVTGTFFISLFLIPRYETTARCQRLKKDLAYNMRADITIYKKMAVEVVEFCCLLLYYKEEQMS